MAQEIDIPYESMISGFIQGLSSTLHELDSTTLLFFIFVGITFGILWAIKDTKPRKIRRSQ